MSQKYKGLNINTYKKTLIYCNKRYSGCATCGELADYSGLVTKKGNEKLIYRCEKHKNELGNGKVSPIDQSLELNRVNSVLKSYIGKEVVSEWHKEHLMGVYLKHNGGIMCQDQEDKWKFVYYHEIKELIL